MGETAEKAVKEMAKEPLNRDPAFLALGKESLTAKWGCGICGARSFMMWMTFKAHLREEHGWIVEVKDFHAEKESE